ncbi:MAG: HEAT repeat domain-containing protein [Nitrospirae bacterium]|nr:HEAT repeat domain-containing protein [Nitrospirota bacterium]
MAKNIKKLIQKLKDKNPSVRKRIIEELAAGDERAVYPLIKALSDENVGVQDAAMRSLIAIGGEVTAYMVLPLLRENTYLRNTALIILTKLGRVSVPFLYPLLKDKDDDVRKFAIDLLADINESIAPAFIVPLLRDGNSNVRAAAARALGLLGYKQAVPELIDALDDEEWVCFSVLEALGELKDDSAVERIASLLELPSEVVRHEAIETLGKLRSDKAADRLAAYLQHAPDEERNTVIKSLIKIGITPDMSNVSDYLLAMLKVGEWEDKEVALKGIEALNCVEAVDLIVDLAGALDPSLPDNEERISKLKATLKAIDSENELLELLESSGMKYRGMSFAIEILGEIKSAKAVPRLIGYLNDARRDLRRASTQALGAIGASESIDPLLETSQRDVDAHVRRLAIEALGAIRSKEAYKPLLELMDIEKYYDVLERIVGSLIQIDAERFLSDVTLYSTQVREIIAKTVTDEVILCKLSEDPEKKVKIAAINGLGRTATEQATLWLSRFLGDSDADVRKAAVVGLGEAHCCSPKLFDSLRDDDPWVRFYAVKTVAFSCERETAIDQIAPLLLDEFIPVVMSAIDAIVELGGREAYEALSRHEDHHNMDVQEKIREALNSL